MTRFISIISGSGDVGKTALSINLASWLRAKGKSPLLLTENTHWMTVPAPEVCDLKEIITGREKLGRHIITGPAQNDAIILRLVGDPGNVLDSVLIDAFCQGVSELNRYDTVLLDSTGGFTHTALSCCLAPCDCLLVVTPQARVLNQSIKLLKALSINGLQAPLNVVVTSVDSRETAEETYALLQETVSAQGLHIPLEYVGFVDQIIFPDTEKSNRPTLLMTDDQKKNAFESIAERFVDSKKSFHGEIRPAAFWAQLIKQLSYPLQIPHVGKIKDGSALPNKLECSLSNSEILPLVKAICEHLGAITSELAQIRAMFQTETPTSAKKHPGIKTGKDLPEIIPLDLDAYAAQNRPRKAND